MQLLEKGWLTLALGFTALFLGLNVGKDLAHKFLPAKIGGTGTAAA